MNNEAYEQIREMLDKEGILNKELTRNCIVIIPGCPYNEGIVILDGNEEFGYDKDNNIRIKDGVISEIIGHDWGYAELLRWFYKKEKHGGKISTWYSITSDGILQCEHIEFENNHIDELFHFDLAKPIQSQDLQSLLAIIKR